MGGHQAPFSNVVQFGLQARVEVMMSARDARCVGVAALCAATALGVAAVAVLGVAVCSLASGSQPHRVSRQQCAAA